MSYELLVVLFLVLSLISALIKKVQEQREQRQPDRNPPSPNRRRDVYDAEEAEVELSEWDVFGDVSPSDPEPEPAPAPREFREVRGTRPVSEAHRGPEFQPVQGKRPVEERPGGEEFREVRGTRPVTEAPALEAPRTRVRFVQTMPGPDAGQRSRRKKRLTFTRKSLRQAIIYSEILGPPRGNQMP